MAEKHSGGISFKDRSGKVHSVTPKHSAARSSEKEDSKEGRKGGHKADSSPKHAAGPRHEAKPKKKHRKGQRPEHASAGPARHDYGHKKRGDGTHAPRGTVGSRRPRAGDRPEVRAHDPVHARPGHAIRPKAEAERPSHHARPGRDERPGRSERPNRGDRPSFKDRVGRGDRAGRADRPNRSDRGSDRGGRHDRPHRKKHQDKSEQIAVQTLKATIDKNRKGFAFVCFDTNKIEDAFLPPRDADSYFHGDRVEVGIDESGAVISIKVIEHRFRSLVGRYVAIPSGRGQGAYVVYERKRAQERLYCPKGAAGASQGDWVLAEVEFSEENGPTGNIVEVYGRELPPRADIGMVAGEYNLVEMHSAEADLEAKSYKLDLEDPNRRDFRNIPFITIDGETARDFDDAIFVERQKGSFVLWVAIADVSHYVKPGTALDKEARSRGTSVYFPERAFHMLPRALSENLCSLKPNEPRLTMVCRMEIGRDGRKTKTEVFEGLIESQRRATYNEIFAESQVHGKDPKWEFAAHFELYQILRKFRSERGSIDFDLPEAEMHVQPTGEVDSIKIRERNDAHRLIEEFMIGANEAVTEWMLERAWPFIYRVHDEPAEKALARFVDLAATVGVNVKIQDRDTGDGGLHQQLNSVIRKLDQHPAQNLLNTALLRSMKQATYSSLHGPHFGLASEGYTHFTSPIRRYPDLVVHRLLRWALQVERKAKAPLGDRERQDLEKELEEICEHCSYRERLATNAERESIKLKQVRIMTRHLGDHFDGIIIGMLESGFFVQIRDPYVEGMVNRDSLTDDFYEYNEQRMVFSGKRKKRTFRIGDKVQVQAVTADLETRTIDFRLVEKNEKLDSKRN